MKLPKIIQGGMGVAISDWNLAKTVSKQGHLGIVSGTGVAIILVARLMDGDPGGHVRRALSHFPFQDSVERVLNKYYVAEPTTPKKPYIRSTMWSVNPPQALNELTIMSNFVEVFLAKEGHNNPVGINLLEKIQMPTMASLYGAVLANVDYVIIGAGIPMQIPGILDDLANHKKVSYRLNVTGAANDDDFHIELDPQAVFPDVVEKVGPLNRPYFLPIISSVVLAKALTKRANGKIDGFVIEAPIAGGHNAPPRGAMKLDELGQPIYGNKDAVDLEQMKQFNLPFWLAGGYDTPEKLQEALDAGAAGVQIGTAFAYCTDSGMNDSLRNRIVEKVLQQDITVRTDPLVSPTGFPFKVAQLEGTISEPDVYRARPRLCDLGMLREIYKRDNGKLGYRCSAEPIDQYVAKGGKEEDVAGRSCLCNNLAATASFPQHRKDGYIEAPIITAGDGLVGITKYIQPGHRSYSAKDVIDYLTGESKSTQVSEVMEMADALA